MGMSRDSNVNSFVYIDHVSLDGSSSGLSLQKSCASHQEQRAKQEDVSNWIYCFMGYKHIYVSLKYCILKYHSRSHSQNRKSVRYLLLNHDKYIKVKKLT